MPPAAGINAARPKKGCNHIFSERAGSRCSKSVPFSQTKFLRHKPRGQRQHMNPMPAAMGGHISLAVVQRNPRRLFQNQVLEFQQQLLLLNRIYGAVQLQQQLIAVRVPKTGVVVPSVFPTLAMPQFMHVSGAVLACESG